MRDSDEECDPYAIWIFPNLYRRFYDTSKPRNEGLPIIFSFQTNDVILFGRIILDLSKNRILTTKFHL
jgi:hypothetical protein